VVDPKSIWAVEEVPEEGEIEDPNDKRPAPRQVAHSGIDDAVSDTWWVSYGIKMGNCGSVNFVVPEDLRRRKLLKVGCEESQVLVKSQLR
jgi:hypothetical protein